MAVGSQGGCESRPRRRATVVPRSGKANASSFNGSLRLGRCVLVAVLALHAAGRSTGTAHAQQPERPAVKEQAPPIIKLPLVVVDPPRNVPAAEWNSPYCGRWSDGCTACTRTNAGGSPQCHRETDGEHEDQSGLRAANCKRHVIICFKEIEATYFDRICSDFLDERFFRRKDGRILAHEYGMKVVWSLSGNEYISDRTTQIDPRLLIGPGLSLLSEDGYGDYDAQRDGSFAGASLAFGLDSSGIRCVHSYAEQ